MLPREIEEMIISFVPTPEQIKREANLMSEIKYLGNRRHDRSRPELPPVAVFNRFFELYHWNYCPIMDNCRCELMPWFQTNWYPFQDWARNSAEYRLSRLVWWERELRKA